MPEALTNRAAFRLIRGHKFILNARSLLNEFAGSCGQQDVMRDMAYFLSKPGVLKRTPVLALVLKEDHKPAEALTCDDLIGALLLFEYSFAGVRSGMFTSNDRSGRGTLLAPPHLRPQVAAFAVQQLVAHGANVVMFSFREEEGLGPSREWPAVAASRTSWATRRREIPDYLPLAATYDETLARIGQRTRSNMRYYRRKAEAQLGCSFHPAVEISTEELLAFNRDCMYAVPDKVAAWRHATLRDLSEPLLMGIRDRDGRWLSLLGARRFNRSSEILWQMNRANVADHSLSLVMRSYFLEHEIACRAQRFYVEGGISHPIRNSFTTGVITDLAALRPAPLTFLARKFGRRLICEDNDLAEMLFDPQLEWSPPGRGFSAPAGLTPTSPRQS